MAITGQSEELEVSHGKSIGDLGNDALWFGLHTFFAVGILAAVWGVITLSQPDPDSTSPKVFATALAFLVPMVGGFLIVRLQRSRRHAEVARYVWISGLLLFAAVCVWVLDLPTGPGLCETCGTVEKLWRTFFEINHGSGLMGGDGLLVGAWVPLSMLGYAAGAALGLGV
jgi:hypothetical protein